MRCASPLHIYYSPRVCQFAVVSSSLLVSSIRDPCRVRSLIARVATARLCTTLQRCIYLYIYMYMYMYISVLRSRSSTPRLQWPVLKPVDLRGKRECIRWIPRPCSRVTCSPKPPLRRGIGMCPFLPSMRMGVLSRTGF